MRHFYYSKIYIDLIKNILYFIHSYNKRGTGSKQINFEIENNTVKNVEFIGGCNGNLQGISRLIEGMNIDDAITKLNGINCNGRGTSYPDQLSIALNEYKLKKA